MKTNARTTLKDIVSETSKNFLYGTLIATAGAILSSKDADAQTTFQKSSDKVNTNEIYLGLDVGDLGPIVRFQKKLPGISPFEGFPFGAYVTASQGLESKFYIKNHLRVGAGAVMYFRNDSWVKMQFFCGGGYSVHSYGDNKKEYEQLAEKWLYKTHSWDFCAGARFGRFNVAIEFIPGKMYGDVTAFMNFGGVSKSKGICSDRKYRRNYEHHSKQQYKR